MYVRMCGWASRQSDTEGAQVKPAGDDDRGLVIDSKHRSPFGAAYPSYILGDKSVNLRAIKPWP